MDAARQYIDHFSLVAAPFGDHVDRRFLWLSEKHLEHIAYLKVGVEQKKGVLLLVGEEGAGKSVLVDCLMRVLPADLKAAVVEEPGVDVPGFFETLSRKFGLENENATKGVFLFQFREFLKQAHSAGERVLLVMESAGAQSEDVLEQVRLLSNLEEEEEKLLNVLLVGDGRLEETLSKTQHRALLQRVATKCRLDALTEIETEAYIRHRMMVAGAFIRIFKPDAVKLIHRFSGGLPKLINLICEHALMHACRDGLRSIDAKLVQRYTDEIRRTFGIGARADLRSIDGGSFPGGRRTGGRWRVLSGCLAALAVAAVLFLTTGIPLEDLFRPRRPRLVDLPPPVTLFFEAGSAELAAGQAAELDGLAGQLAQWPRARVAVRGYSDSRGSEAQNRRISQQRAETVQAYLLEKGVRPEKIDSVGLGSENPAPGGPGWKDPGFGRRAEIRIVAGNAR